MPSFFLDDLVSPYFEDIGAGYNAALIPGQICWAPILYGYDRMEIWRPDSTDQTGTIASLFKVTTAGSDAFNRNAPLSSPRLTTREEFPVIRAKIRPVIFLTPPSSSRPTTGGRGENRIDRGISLVAPLYSILDPVNQIRKYDAELVERIRTLEYAQFSYIPADSNARIRESIVRVDALQGVQRPHLERTRTRLCDDALRILQAQIETYILGRQNTLFHDVREQLLHP